MYISDKYEVYSLLKVKQTILQQIQYSTICNQITYVLRLFILFLELRVVQWELAEAQFSSSRLIDRRVKATITAFSVYPLQSRPLAELSPHGAVCRLRAWIESETRANELICIC